MSAVLLPQGKQQYFTSAGIPLVGGKVFTYDTGTTTPRTTWADAAQASPNANPVILDARGEASIFWSGAYRVVVQDSLGNAIWTQDGVSDASFTSTLIADLASTSDGAKGAGMIGFNALLTYTANRVGSFLTSVFGRTAAEVTFGVTPTNLNWFPFNFRRNGAVGNDVTDDTIAITNGMLTVSPMTTIDLNGGRYKTTAFSNALGSQFSGGGFVEVNNVVKTAWGRRYPLSFGSELLYAFQARIKAGQPFRATFTGDSTTLGTGVSAGYTVPELFIKAAQRMGGIGCTTVNRGQGGKSTVDWLSTYLAGDLVPQPHLLCIRWGINDPYTAGANLTPAQSIANIRTGLATIRASYGVKDLSIILCTPNSTSDSAQGRDERFDEQIIHGYRQAALDYQCAFLDIYSLCQDSRGGTYASGNAAASLWMDDPYLNGSAVHPGDIMASQIATHLAELACRGLGLINGGLSMDNGQYASKFGADLPVTYPTGISLYRADATGGTPFIRDGFVLTSNHPDDGQMQINWGFGSQLSRSIRTRFGRANAWDPWDNVYIAPALLNAWVNVGATADTAGYTRDAYGRVYLKGRISTGATAANTPLFVLPAGFRPTGDAVFIVGCAGALGQVQIIAATGSVQFVAGNNTYLSLEGINFIATG